MKPKSNPSNWKRKIPGWIARLVGLSLLLAMIDCSAGYFLGTTVCSIPIWKMKDGGTTSSVGFGYFLTYYRRMDAKANGPEVWFWFTPFVISAAHRHVELRWLWKQDDQT